MFLIILENAAFADTPLRTRPLATPTATFNREPVVISGSLIIAITMVASIVGTVFFFYYRYVTSKKVIEDGEPESRTDKDKDFKKGKKRRRCHKKHSNNTPVQQGSAADQERTPLLQSQDQESYYSYYYEEEEDEENKGTKANSTCRTSNVLTNPSTFILSESENNFSDQYEIPPEADKASRKGPIMKIASETDALMSMRINLNSGNPKAQKLRQSSIFFGADRAHSLENGPSAGITAQSSLQIPSYITEALRPSDDGSSSSSELSLAKIPVDM